MSDERKETGNPETCDGGPATCSVEEMRKCGCAASFGIKDKKQKQ